MAIVGIAITDIINFAHCIIHSKPHICLCKGYTINTLKLDKLYKIKVIGDIPNHYEEVIVKAFSIDEVIKCKVLKGVDVKYVEIHFPKDSNINIISDNQAELMLELL